MFGRADPSRGWRHASPIHKAHSCVRILSTALMLGILHPHHDSVAQPRSRTGAPHRIASSIMATTLIPGLGVQAKLVVIVTDLAEVLGGALSGRPAAERSHPHLPLLVSGTIAAVVAFAVLDGTACALPASTVS